MVKKNRKRIPSNASDISEECLTVIQIRRWIKYKLPFIKTFDRRIVVVSSANDLARLTEADDRDYCTSVKFVLFSFKLKLKFSYYVKLMDVCQCWRMLCKYIYLKRKFIWPGFQGIHVPNTWNSNLTLKNWKTNKFNILIKFLTSNNMILYIYIFDQAKTVL